MISRRVKFLRPTICTRKRSVANFRADVRPFKATAKCQAVKPLRSRDEDRYFSGRQVTGAFDKRNGG